ncbi:MAG: hypothetical protein CSA66_05810 [Proteobacteria bacterium]|nr:MAG: hypothetical protein CSA66_05810 [Pseudomonadota bacterium]
MLRTFAATLAPALALALLPGCTNDQDGKFDAFVERSEPFRGELTEETCEERFDISGDYMLTMSTHLSRDKPLLLGATFAVDPATWEVSCDFHMLNLTDAEQADRAEVGALYSASGTIAEDGSFTLDFGIVDVPAAANPITFSEIQANLVLEGCTKSADLACGAVEGNVVTPHIDLATSTWGSARVDGDITTAPVVLSCAATADQ